MKTCPACHVQNTVDATACSSCGYRFDSPFSVDETRIGAHDIGGFITGDIMAGRYEVVRELGRGGMGMVFLVKDTDLRGSRVALKMIHPRLVEHPEALQRFVDEVIICQRLNHPNIVKVHDLKRLDALRFFTMEYVAGRSLRELIAERRSQSPPFSLSEIISLINPLLDALSYAHRYTIHRDIKPENIIITGEFPKVGVKVLDFGIAKTLSASRFTQTAQALGTAYYMAPEQMAGGEVDYRADLYAVGMILYELCTGKMAVGIPKLPSKLNPALPKDIDIIVSKILKPKPHERYKNADEVQTTLAGALISLKDQKKRKQQYNDLERLVERAGLAVVKHRWDEAENLISQVLDKEYHILPTFNSASECDLCRRKRSCLSHKTKRN